MYGPNTDLSYDVRRGPKPPTNRPSWWVWHYVVHFAIAFAALLSLSFLILTMMRHSACLSDQLVRTQQTLDIGITDPSKGLSIGLDYGRVNVHLVESDARTVTADVTMAALSDTLLSLCKVQHANGLLRVTQPKYSIHNCYKGVILAKVPSALLKEGTVPLKVVSQYGDVMIHGSSENLHTVGDVYVRLESGVVHLENLVARSIRIACSDSCKVTTRQVKAYFWDIAITHEGGWLDSDAFIRGPVPTQPSAMPSVAYKAQTGHVRLRSLEFESSAKVAITTGYDISITTKGFTGKYTVDTEGSISTPGGVGEKEGKMSERVDQEIVLKSTEKGAVALTVQKIAETATALPSKDTGKDPTDQ